MALKVRIEAIEAKQAGRLAASKEELAAQRVAGELGFSPEVLMLPSQRKQRRALAIALRDKGWSVTRIARALRCSERTIGRWGASRTGTRQCPDTPAREV